MKKNLRVVLILAVCCMLICGMLALVACNKDDITPTAELKNNANGLTIDLADGNTARVNLPELFKGSVEGFAYTLTPDEHIEVSAISENGIFTVTSDNTPGSYKIAVKVLAAEKEILAFNYSVTVTNDPTVIAQPQAATVNTYLDAADVTDAVASLKLDLNDYFKAVDSITYELACEDATVVMTADADNAKNVTVTFGKTGEKAITIYALNGETRKASVSFNCTVTGVVPTALYNGGFDNGYDGWYLTAEEKAAYTINDSATDIWGNPVGATGNYLYGYTNEAFNTANFRSSMFKVDGSGIITFKLAGNCTDTLQFVLMQYNAEGEDVEIAKFNNWYFGSAAESGFIFHQYYYQLDMETYNGSYCYFKVIDNLDSYFAFVNVDDIVTYYAEAPDTFNMLKAGFCTRPAEDLTDTSGLAFPADLSVVGTQLENGNFNKGYNGWYMSTADKEAYSINNSETDIWGNPVGVTGRYLYGFANEAYAAANFHSSLFKVDGSGMITFKLAGNCGNNLQFVLMQYNAEGDDVEIAKFNNWYFGTVSESGFIFHQYYYQLDMETYNGSYCYFKVIDNAADGGFAFVNVADIVTYYATAPDTTDMIKGGFCTNPNL